jgi:hypothetical protein
MSLNSKSIMPQIRLPWLRSILCLNALIPAIYLLIPPYRGYFDALYVRYPLMVILSYSYLIVAVIFFSLSLLRPFWGTAIQKWLATRAQWSIWLMVLLFWLTVLRLGILIGEQVDDIFELAPFYLWGMGIGLSVLWVRHGHLSQVSQPGIPQPYLGIVAVVFALLSLVRDGLVLWAFSYFYAHDSESYLYNWGRFTDEATIAASRRSIPYPLMNALVNSTDDPWRILWLQILIAALTVGMLVYVIGKKNALLAVTLGTLLVLDANWGTSNRAILTESSYISFHLLAFALLLEHYDHHPYLHWWWVVLGGIFYGWTLTIRPSGLLLGIPIILAYAWFTRSIYKTGLVTVGLVSFLLVTGLFNAWRGSEFGISSQTGVFVAYPLFDYDLFSPDNGETSRELDAALRSCYDDPKYGEFNARNANNYIHTFYRRCLNSLSGGDAEYEAHLYGGAYREAVMKHPITFAKRVVTEMGRVFSYAVQNNVWEIGEEKRPSTPCSEIGGQQYGWCQDVPTAFRLAPWDDFVADTGRYMQYPLQPHLIFLPTEFHDADYVVQPDQFEAYDHPDAPAQSIAAMVALLMLGGFLIVITHSRERFLVIAGLVFIGYLALSVVAGHIFLPRYARPLSPFYIILAAILLMVLIRAIRFPDIPLPAPQHIPGLVGMVVIILAIIIVYLFVESHQTQHYTSISIQAEHSFAELDSDMIYNPKPFNPDPWSAKWANPGAFKDDELSEANQGQLALWTETLLPGYLRSTGIAYLVFDQVWWRDLSAEQQAIILNPQYYELVQTWHDETMRQDIWLYRLIGDGRPPIYTSPALQVFQTVEGAFDFYRIEGNNGVFVARVDPQNLVSAEHLFEANDGWRVRLLAQDGHYQAQLIDPAGKIVDETFTFPY